MPPLISLETSIPKAGVFPHAIGGNRAWAEGDGAGGSIDGTNVIQFSSPDPRISSLLQLFDNSPSAIVLLDTYDHVIDCNPAFTAIFQYTLPEIRNLPLTDFIVPKGHMREAIEMTLKTLRGEVVLQTLKRRRKDGALIDVELSAYPIRLNASRIGIYTIYTDVTERELLQQHTHQGEMYQTLGRLAGSTGREVNTILGSLMAGMRILDHTRPDSGSSTPVLHEMNLALERGVALVERLFAFAGKSEFQTETVRDTFLLQELHEMFETIVAGHRVSVSAGIELEPCAGASTRWNDQS